MINSTKKTIGTNFDDYQFTSSSKNGPPSHFDHELYHEEDDKVLPVIRVKNIKLSGNQERWKIFHDTKIFFIVESKKLNKQERAFLHTATGLTFLLSVGKKPEVPTFGSFRQELQEKIPADFVAPEPEKKVAPKTAEKKPKKNKLVGNKKN